MSSYRKPGHAAEDEVLYGTSDPTHHPPPANEPQLHTEPKAEKNHTVLRQMLCVNSTILSPRLNQEVANETKQSWW